MSNILIKKTGEIIVDGVVYNETFINKSIVIRNNVFVGDSEPFLTNVSSEVSSQFSQFFSNFGSGINQWAVFGIVIVMAFLVYFLWLGHRYGKKSDEMTEAEKYEYDIKNKL